jgi:hypothetical protein
MPRGDGTGPPKGDVLSTGKGRGGGGGRMGGNRPGSGPGGYCICSKCGVRLTHQQGTPCYNLNCPKCGTTMVRG